MLRTVLVLSLAAQAWGFSLSPSAPTLWGLSPSATQLSARNLRPAARQNRGLGLRMEELELTDAGRRQLNDLEGQWKNICVLGGSRGVGREVINNLAAMEGVNVVALVRKEETKKELEALDGVKGVIGDALEAADVIGVLDGCDAVVSTLGRSGIDDESGIDYKGNMNFIENAGILGVTRMVFVTSIGCGDSKEALSPETYAVLEKALKDKTKAENLLLKYYTNSDYTIIRPGGLVSDDASGKAILTEDKMSVGSISRKDVADLVVDTLYSKKASKKILHAVDPSRAKDGKAYEEFKL